MPPYLLNPSTDLLMRVLGGAGLVAFGLLVGLASRSPIFRIDVLTATRRFRYFLVRILYGMVLFFVLWVCYEGSFRSESKLTLRTSAEFANAFFVGFSWVQVLAVLVLTPAVVAGTIATERERRTIEYLFATDLSNFELIGGKLLSRLALLLVVLILALPILQLARLFGGIRNDDLLAAFVIAASTLAAVSGLSIARSVWARRGRDAVISTYVILLALLIGPPIVKGLLSAASSGLWPLDLLDEANEFLIAANPIAVLIRELSTFGTRSWDNLQWMVMLHAGFAAVCLLTSVVAVRRVHLRASGAPARKRLEFRLPRPRPGVLPMLWKELFTEPLISRMGIFAGLALGVLIFLVVGLMGWVFLESYNTTTAWGGSRDWALQEFRGWTALISTLLCLALLLAVAAKASSSITGEKEKDTWISLLSTRLSGNEIVLAKIAGSIYQVRWMGLLLAFIWMLALIRAPSLFILTVPWQCITFVAVASFLSALGVHFSLWCSSSVRAMAATLSIGIFIGGAYLFCCAPFLFFGAGDGAQLILAPCIPFLLAFPVMWDPSRTVPSHEVGVFIAYLLGTGGYALGAIVLYGSAVTNFETLCERVHRTMGQRAPRPVVAPPSPTAPAEEPPASA